MVIVEFWIELLYFIVDFFILVIILNFQGLSYKQFGLNDYFWGIEFDGFVWFW